MYPNNTKIIKTTTRHKSLQRHKIFELNILLPKYQSVERVTLFLLVGSFDLRTGHLAILWGRCRHVFHTRIRIL